MQSTHLLYCDVLLVPVGDDFVEGEYEVEGRLADGLLVRGSRKVRHDLCQKAKGLQVFQDVGVEVGDEQQVQVLQEQGGGRERGELVRGKLSPRGEQVMQWARIGEKDREGTAAGVFCCTGAEPGLCQA